MDQSQVRKLAALIVAAAVFVVVLHLLQSTNVLAFMVDAGVQSGTVSASVAPQTTSFSEIGLGLLSTLLFVFSRFGAALMAFVQVLIFGAVNGTGGVTTKGTKDTNEEAKGEVKTAIGYDPQADVARQRQLMAQLFDAASTADKAALVSVACEIRGEKWITATAVRAKKAGAK